MRASEMRQLVFSNARGSQHQFSFSLCPQAVWDDIGKAEVAWSVLPGLMQIQLHQRLVQNVQLGNIWRMTAWSGDYTPLKRSVRHARWELSPIAQGHQLAKTASQVNSWPR